MFNLADIKQKAARSALALISRQLFSKAIAFGANIVLARLLIPEQFGLFAIVSFAVTTLTLVADAGLGASLLRQEADPSEEERATVFTAHQILVCLPMLLLFAIAEPICHAYRLSDSSAWLIRFLSLSGFITSFRFVPQISLERQLEFGKLSRIEMIESCAYQLISVLGACAGQGAWCFGYAAVFSQLIATVLTYWVHPWRLHWAWHLPVIRQRLRYSVHYQSASIVAFIKDAVNPLFIGLLLGSKAVGLVTFASMQATYPVWAVSILGRLYIPVLAKVQKDREHLRHTIESVLFWNCLLVFGLTSVLMPLIQPVVPLVFGDKWLPAVPLIYLLAAANPILSVSWPAMAVANAVGRSDIVLRYQLIWTVLTWVLTVPLVVKFGAVGFGIAYFLVQFTNYWLIQDVRKLVDFAIGPSVLPSLIAGLLNAALLLAIKQLWGQHCTLLGGLCLGALGIVTFVGLCRLVWGPGLWRERLSLASKPSA